MLLLDHESLRRRAAVLSLPALISRCRSTLASYVADKKICGNLPFASYTPHNMIMGCELYAIETDNEQQVLRNIDTVRPTADTAHHSHVLAQHSPIEGFCAAAGVQPPRRRPPSGQHRGSKSGLRYYHAVDWWPCRRSPLI